MVYKKGVSRILVVLISILVVLLATQLFYTFSLRTSGSVVLEETKESESLAHIRFAIELTKAEHLDANKNLINNIYDQIKDLDGVWSETISSEEYLRITFEQELSSENDITIYPRVINGNPKIEVYEKNNENLLAEFSDLIQEEYNKVLLTNLEATQNTFDLKLVEGELQFDHIIDPLNQPVSSLTKTYDGGSTNIRYECAQDSDCNETDQVCWNHVCVKLFDIKIIDFESPRKLGDFFEFTYLAKGMANISEDVEILFWIEKQGEIITSGSDTIYIGNLEEKIETTKIFLPESVESGVYQFYVQVSYEAYTAKSHRTIEIEIKEGGITGIISIPDKSKISNYLYYIIILLVLVIIIIFGIVLILRYRKRRKTKIIKPKPIRTKPVRIKWPKIQLPKFRLKLPKFRFRLPQKKTPKFEFKLPQKETPKFKFLKTKLLKVKPAKPQPPRIKLPKWKLKFPKFRFPRAKIFKVKPKRPEPPKVKKPKFRLKLPKFRFRLPQKKTPEFKIPKYKIPKIKPVKKEIPRIKKPKFRLKLPKFRFRLPQKKTPEFKFPKYKVPKIKPVKKEVPKIKRKFKLKLPKFRFRLPQKKTPEFKFPRSKIVPRLRRKEEKSKLIKKLHLSADDFEKSLKPKRSKLPKIKLPKWKFKFPKFRLPRVKPAKPEPPKIKILKIRGTKFKLPREEKRKVGIKPRGFFKRLFKKFRIRVPRPKLPRLRRKKKRAELIKKLHSSADEFEQSLKHKKTGF
jgi:hypothetical protein